MFDRPTVDALRKWLVRRIAKLELPQSSSVKPLHFKSHDLRTSKITYMIQVEKMTVSNCMAFTGHKSINSFNAYLKVDINKLLDKILEKE